MNDDSVHLCNFLGEIWSYLSICPSKPEEQGLSPFHLKGQYTLHLSPRRWFVWKILCYNPQKANIQNSSQKIMPVQNGGFQETACPKDRQDRSWLSPYWRGKQNGQNSLEIFSQEQFLFEEEMFIRSLPISLFQILSKVRLFYKVIFISIYIQWDSRQNWVNTNALALRAQYGNLSDKYIIHFQVFVK